MAVKFDDDWIAFPHPVGVLETLKGVLEESRLPAPCTTAVVPGEQVALDYVGDECDSFCWGRVTSVYPSSSFPEQDPTRSRILTFASSMELGIVRRAPVPDNGEPASEEELYDASRLQMADMRAMLEALCAYAGDDIPIVVGPYQPIGPEGGVVGGFWTATLGTR